MRCETHDLPLDEHGECEECRIDQLRRQRPGMMIEERSELLPADYDDFDADYDMDDYDAYQEFDDGCPIDPNDQDERSFWPNDDV